MIEGVVFVVIKPYENSSGCVVAAYKEESDARHVVDLLNKESDASYELVAVNVETFTK